MRLIIEASDGADYVADARLTDDRGAGGRTLAEGQASIAARRSFSAVATGVYRFARLREFPAEPAVQTEFGRHGLLFDPVSTAAGGEPLLVHGGDFGAPGQRRAASGSVRLEAPLLSVVVARVQQMGVTAARAGLVLELRIGERPPFWKFWAQPARTRAVVVDDDDDAVDFFDVLVPELAPYRHPNSAMAWTLYFDHERRVDDDRHHLHYPAATDSASARSAEPADVSDSPRDAPLFAVSPLPGTDAQGRVVEAAPAQRLAAGAENQADRNDQRDDALRAAGLTLTALAAEAIEADPLASMDSGASTGPAEPSTDSPIETSTQY